MPSDNLENVLNQLLISATFLICLEIVQVQSSYISWDNVAPSACICILSAGFLSFFTVLNSVEEYILKNTYSIYIMWNHAESYAAWDTSA